MRESTNPDRSMYHSAPIGTDGALDQFGLPAVADIFAQ